MDEIYINLAYEHCDEGWVRPCSQAQVFAVLSLPWLAQNRLGFHPLMCTRFRCSKSLHKPTHLRLAGLTLAVPRSMGEDYSLVGW